MGLKALNLHCCWKEALPPAASATSRRKPFIFKKNLFLVLLSLFLAVLGLWCCELAFSSCSERWLLFLVARRLLTVMASLVSERRL